MLNQNFTGLSWYLDTHVHDHPDSKILRDLYELGWIHLQVPDTVILELSQRFDPSHRKKLLDSVSVFPTYMGTYVFDHSVIGLAFVGTNEDKYRIQTVHSCLWSGNTFDSDAKKSKDGNSKARTRLRDTLIVSTCIKYHSQGLITNDQQINHAAPRVREKYPAFRTLTINEATTIAINEVKKMCKSGMYTDLPELPKELTT